jgi:predicted membrane protein
VRARFSNLIWGTFLILAAAFILINQLNGFVNLGIGSIVLAVLAVIFFVQCIADLHIAQLPIPIAVLYIVFQSPLGMPYFRPWTLILVAALITAGLTILIPRKYKYRHYYKSRLSRQAGASGEGSPDESAQYNAGGDDNNPVVNVNFGGISRHIYATSLETVQLNSSFGALEIFFDQAVLSPNGAEVILNCSLGGITLYIPRHWKVIDRVKCTLGGIDMDKQFTSPAEDAPQLTLSGSVSLGGIEVRYI